MYQVLTTTKSDSVDRFLEIYEKDRFLARIFALENSPSEHYTGINEISKDNFQLFTSQKTYGVSVTLKLHCRRKDTEKILINKTKFYRVVGRSLIPLCITNLGNGNNYDIISERFTWVRFLKESGFNDISFNTIVRHKLYDRNKVSKYMYGCDFERAEVIMQHFSYRDWKVFKRSMINVQNINMDLFEGDGALDPSTIQDTIQLAFKLNVKVNMAWSCKRMKTEHDEMSQKLTAIVIEMNDRPLNIHPVFKEFAKEIAGELIDTTKRLAIEGAEMKHCVVSYASSIDNGNCAIYHFKKHTVEVRVKDENLEVRQFKGFMNKDAPIEIQAQFIETLQVFNQQRKDAFKLPFEKKQYHDPHQLPF